MSEGIERKGRRGHKPGNERLGLAGRSLTSGAEEVVSLAGVLGLGVVPAGLIVWKRRRKTRARERRS